MSESGHPDRRPSSTTRVLWELATAGEPLPVRELRNRTGATHAATKKALHTLRDRNYVQKVGTGQSTQWLIKFPEEGGDE